MKTILWVLIVLVLASCETNDPIEDVKISDELVVETPDDPEEVLVFTDIADLSTSDSVSITIDLSVNKFKNSLSHVIYVSLHEVEFTLKSDSALEYDYIMTMSQRDQTVDIYFKGLLSKEVTILMENKDGYLYESTDFDEEIIFMIYEKLSKEKIRLEEYVLVSEYNGYELYKLSPMIYNKYTVQSYNPDFFHPLIKHPAVIEETEENGEVVYTIVSHAYTEYLTTRLKYYDLNYYITYMGNEILLSECMEVPAEVLLNLIDNLTGSDLFLFSIIPE